MNPEAMSVPFSFLSAGYPVNISLLATYEEPDTADENSYPGDYNIRYNASVSSPGFKRHFQFSPTVDGRFILAPLSSPM